VGKRLREKLADALAGFRWLARDNERLSEIPNSPRQDLRRVGKDLPNSFCDIRRAIKSPELFWIEAVNKFDAVYQELRNIAHQVMTREAPGQTLQPTALVHEAYFRLSKAEPDQFQSRGEFLAAAANAMRQVLIDTARRKRAQKRGGDRSRALIDLDQVTIPDSPDAILALDAALDALHAQDASVARVVQLRFFGGMTHTEIAEVMGVSRRTVNEYWAYGKVWLARSMKNDRD
jgi:RNA polymerase sigma factor (TIGR02999 family)